MFNSWHCKNIAVNAQPASSEKSPCLILLMIDCCKDIEMISAACHKKPFCSFKAKYKTTCRAGGDFLNAG